MARVLTAHLTTSTVYSRRSAYIVAGKTAPSVTQLLQRLDEALALWQGAV